MTPFLVFLPGLLTGSLCLALPSGTPGGLPAEVALAPQNPGQGTSVRAELDQLGSGQAARREEATRWLVRNLLPEDLGSVREAAQNGSLAVRYGLSDVLARHPRHFPIACELTVAPGEAAQEVGLWALEHAALQWNPALADGPLKSGSLPEEWTQDSGRTQTLTLRPATPRPGGLPLALAQLDRFGDAPVPLVLDPKLDPMMREPKAPRRGADSATGPWHNVLSRLCTAHRTTFQVWGWKSQEELGGTDQVPTFLVVRAMGRPESGSGAVLLARWIQGAAQAEDREKARSFARALAQSHWPAALTWLDGACRAGRAEFWPALCLGMETGRIPGRLLTTEGLHGLLDWAIEREVGSTERRWDRLHLARRALLRVPSVLSKGESLGECLQEWARDKDQRAQWLALQGMSGLDRPDPGLATWAHGFLEQANGDLSVRRAALHACAVLGDHVEVRSLPGASALLSSLDDRGFERVLHRVERCRFRPSPGEDWSTAFPTKVPRIALWWQSLGQGEPAARLLEGAMGRPKIVEECWQLWAAPVAQGSESHVRALLGLTDEPSVDGTRVRIALGLGLLTDQEALDHLDTILARERLTPEDWIDLGFLSGHSRWGSRARGTFLGAFAKGVPEEVLWPALKVAVQSVRTLRDSVVLDNFEGDLRRAAMRSAHPMAPRVVEWDWREESPAEPVAPLGSGEPTPPK